MKSPVTVNVLILCSITALITLAALFPVNAEPAQVPGDKSAVNGKMMEGCQALMDKKQKLSEDIKAQDIELADHVAKMNAAPENEKLAIATALLTHLVQQQGLMDARRADMEEEMMHHMMQNMQMSKEDMAQCPMMKDMKGHEHTSAPEQSTHKLPQN